MSVSTLSMRPSARPSALRPAARATTGSGRMDGRAAATATSVRPPTSRLARPALLAAPPTSSPRPSVLMRHGDGDDDGVLPLLRLPRRAEDPIDPRTLHPTPLLGGKTVGEELALIAQSYRGAEEKARRAMEDKLYTSERGGAWAGDVYVGRPGEKYDVLQVLAAIAFLTPVVGLGVAMATWGTYWGNYTG